MMPTDQVPLLWPAPLQPGSTVEIVAPSGWVRPAYLEGAAAELGSRGWNVRFGRHAFGRCGTFSATAAERLHDFARAWLDPDVACVFCARGGYGAVQLLEPLSRLPLRDNCKWLTGYSDITALHALMRSQSIVSLHSPMARHLAEQGADNPMTRRMLDMLGGARPSLSLNSHPFNRPGRCRGPLAVGNLAVASGLTATPFDILGRGGILVLEDVGEHAYKVERMMWQLELSGALARLDGLIVGQFTGDVRTLDGEDAPSIIARMTERYSFPRVFNAPVGHVAANAALPSGAEARLDVGPEGATLSFI